MSHSEHPTRHTNNWLIVSILIVFISVLAFLFIGGYFVGKIVEHNRMQFDMQLNSPTTNHNA